MIENLRKSPYLIRTAFIMFLIGYMGRGMTDRVDESIAPLLFLTTIACLMLVTNTIKEDNTLHFWQVKIAIGFCIIVLFVIFAIAIYEIISI